MDVKFEDLKANQIVLEKENNKLHLELIEKEKIIQGFSQAGAEADESKGFRKENLLLKEELQRLKMKYEGGLNP